MNLGSARCSRADGSIHRLGEETDGIDAPKVTGSEERHENRLSLRAAHRAVPKIVLAHNNGKPDLLAWLLSAATLG